MEIKSCAIGLMENTWKVFTTNMQTVAFVKVKEG